MNRKQISLAGQGVTIEVGFDSDSPVSITAIRPHAGSSPVSGGPLVDVFTASEQKSIPSRSYVASKIGTRMRYLAHSQTSDAGIHTLTIDQVDPITGLRVTTMLTIRDSAAAVQFRQIVHNEGKSAVVVTAVTSAAIVFGGQAGYHEWDLFSGEGEWVAEGRWRHRQLQDAAPAIDVTPRSPQGNTRFSQTSHGSWTTGTALPTGVLLNRNTQSAIAWQIETSGAWHWEIGQIAESGYLSLLGPAEREHQFATRIEPGAAWEAATAAIAVSGGGRDGALGELTLHRRAIRLPASEPDRLLPIVYNDYMNTLVGDQTTEALIPLVEAAAAVGAEYFCIDAGWSDAVGETDWWSGCGEWREAAGRFTGGLRRVTDAIRQHGMSPGLWLEPEVVGVRSPIAQRLPDEAFFHRFGSRLSEQGRYHLDLRHPAAVAHLDDTIDFLVAEYGLGYFKLDYNINPGTGTDLSSLAPGEGLLDHGRAYRSWLVEARERHPSVLFENCSAGAMRMDYALMSVAHMQSTSDQTDYLKYPPIAASAPASILPEQCGNWAYPAEEMTWEATAFSMVAGLAGRLYLSGFLHRLPEANRALVVEAVATSKAWRTRLAASLPGWPLGLPGWADEVIALRLDMGDEALLAIWNRGPATVVEIDGPKGWTTGVATVATIFPASAPETGIARFGGATLSLPEGPFARLYHLTSNARLS
jgi:alpha-galactosidase